MQKLDYEQKKNLNSDEFYHKNMKTYQKWKYIWTNRKQYMMIPVCQTFYIKTKKSKLGTVD